MKWIKKNPVNLLNGVNPLKILIVVLLFGVLDLSAQDTLIHPANHKYNFSEFRHETGLLFKSPVKWNGNDWIKFGATAIITYGIMFADEDVRRASLDNPKYAKSVPMEIGKQWGGFVVVPVSAVLLYSHGLLARNPTTKKLGFEIAQAALYSETISFITKGCVGRSRPFTDKGAKDYKPFTFFDSPHNSFPAGHIDAAFALSTVLARNTNSAWLKVLVYIPAGLSVVSRIYQDEHWASDVFPGAVLGYFVATWVTSHHEETISRVQLSSLYPFGLTISLD